MKFSKYRNPNKRRNHPVHNRDYIEERKSEMRKALAEAKTESERLAIVKAYSITINP